MTICVVDGRGGGLGSRMVAGLRGLVDDGHAIVGSLSLLMPGSMLGEVTPVLAQAVLESSARKVLLPLNKRKVEVVGVEGRTLDALIDHALQRCVSLLQATA